MPRKTTALKATGKRNPEKVDFDKWQRIEAAFDQLVSEIDYGHIPSENVRSAYIRFVRDHRLPIELDDAQPNSKWREVILTYIGLEMQRVCGGIELFEQSEKMGSVTRHLLNPKKDAWQRDDGSFVIYADRLN